ncbi:caffeic acid 3-O-methyltransferase [Artemisia annua]|uniref:Caffeic acid 3-O-methyltransferase n=1 Tax=Artemisia annua TaxID=35608 RepID=A0A2U1L2E2_ARTAN|nr:caffeic acid 3-O-methyltransferase [Artemisia annua]
MGTNEDQSTYAMQLVTSTSLTMVLVSSIKLKVLDAIAEAGPNAQLSAHEIATRLKIPNQNAPAMIDRMLRLLASHSVVTCTERNHDSRSVRVYGLTPVAKYFIPNEDGVSLGAFMELLQDKIFINNWFGLADSVVEGGVSFDKIYGTRSDEYPAHDARFNAVFNKAMVNHTTIVMKEILERYHGFKNIKSMVDVGGGLGMTLNMIVLKYPTIKGINFDQPQYHTLYIVHRSILLSLCLEGMMTVVGISSPLYTTPPTYSTTIYFTYDNVNERSAPDDSQVVFQIPVNSLGVVVLTVVFRIVTLVDVAGTSASQRSKEKGKAPVIEREELNLMDIKPGDLEKPIEVKKGLLLPYLEHEQARTLWDMRQFDSGLQIGSCYKIEWFGCKGTENWQRTLNNPITLLFGRYTLVTPIENDGFADHYFNFIAYNKIGQRADTRDYALTDYIGIIRSIGHIKESGDPTTNRILQRNIDIQNLNGNVLTFTMWNEMASNFQLETLGELEQPVVIAVSSCWARRFSEDSNYQRPLPLTTTSIRKWRKRTIFGKHMKK